MDSVFDQQLLEGFVASLFQPKCFDLNFPLCRSLFGGRRKPYVSMMLPAAIAIVPAPEWVSRHTTTPKYRNGR